MFKSQLLKSNHRVLSKTVARYLWSTRLKCTVLVAENVCQPPSLAYFLN